MTMTTETTRLPAGSSHSQPVNPITIPAATTPAVTSVSAAMCMKAALTLRSLARPEANSSAVPPLTAIPAAPTQTMIPLTTGTGWVRRNTASQAMPPVTTSKMTALASAARIELERSP